MRKDMDKVLVTTPRIGSNRKNAEVRKSRRIERDGSYDDLPSYSSMKPKVKNWWGRKELNEYLNPLIRYLKKNCDRPWNKVYSDICKNMDHRGAVQGHIFQHLFDYVELHPVFKNGKPHRVKWGLIPLYKTGYTFYVDKNGFLKEPKEKRPPWREVEVNPNLIKTNDDSIFYVRRAADGTWFKVSLEVWPDFDYVSSSSSLNPDWVVEAIGERVIGGKYVRMKTLSKKEKRSLEIV